MEAVTDYVAAFFVEKSHHFSNLPYRFCQKIRIRYDKVVPRE